MKREDLKLITFNKEKQIVINLILHDDYCRRVLPVIRENYFRSNYIYTIIKWITKYFKKYNKAPRGNIQNIYESKLKKLDSEEAEYIGSVLHHLSECANNDINNIQYLIDDAHQYLKDRHIEVQTKTAEQHIANGEHHKADKVLSDKFQAVEGNSYEILNMASKAKVIETVRWMIERRDPDTSFFRLSGRLGDFIGSMDKGWLVSFLAPPKRGKTTYMLDASIDSIMQQHNTMIFSHEMTLKEIHSRYLTSINGILPGIDTYSTIIPVFDCALNQSGECELSKRKGSGSLIDESDGTVVLTYEDFPDWVPCTVCRKTPNFEPAIWSAEITKEKINESDFIKKSMGFNRLYGKYCRAIYMPSRTVTVQDLQSEVQSLIYTENFIPDVIIIDYADLLLPKINSGIKRHDLDDIWEDLRAWGKSTNTLIITASQTNRGSTEKKFLSDTDIAEDFSKIAKLDLGIGLCQSDLMKSIGLMNFNIVAYRHKEFIQSHVCSVLQDIKHGNATLDSEFKVLR